MNPWNDALDAALDELERCREEGETDLRCLRARIESHRQDERPLSPCAERWIDGITQTRPPTLRVDVPEEHPYWRHCLSAFAHDPELVEAFIIAVQRIRDKAQIEALEESE